MQIVILLLLVAALAMLVLALIGGNSALGVCSIALSLIAVAVIVRGRQRRAELARARQAEAERLAKQAAEEDEATRQLAAAAAEAGRRAAATPASATEAVSAAAPATAVLAAEPPLAAALEVPADEPSAADTIAPLERHGQARVWVIDGRPRYHLTECRRVDSAAEPISLAQAVTDGFTPCAECDPDNRITG